MHCASCSRTAKPRPTSRRTRAFRSGPSTPRLSEILTGRPSHAGSIIALLLCLIGTVAVTHLLEMLRTRREGDTLENVDLDWVLDEDVDEAPDADEEAAGRGAIVLPAFRTRPER